MLTKEFIHALNWTLIHSTWQGMILSIVAGAIVLLTKKYSSAIRYNLLTGVLLIFIIVVGATFSFEIIKVPQPAEVAATIAKVQVISQDAQLYPKNLNNKLSITAEAIRFLNMHAGWIVLTWLLIMGLRCIQFTVGLYGIYRLKTKQVFDPGKYWNNRINELSRQLRINKRVTLLQSGIAKVPAVIGYFSPVILFPASMFTMLKSDEIEAILVHELAHIHRHDFLINILQCIIEIIFFFNPAVLWVSSLIKSERENCCDDIAVMQTGGKRNYINALMAFGEINVQPALTLTNAFSGKKHYLINRVKRIIYNNNQTLSNMEKKFLAAGIILTGTLVFAFSSNIAQQKETEKKSIEQNNTIARPESKSSIVTLTDTIPGSDVISKDVSNETIHTTINGKKYQMITHDGQIDELYINDKKIPADQLGNYKSETDKIMVQLKMDKMQAEKDTVGEDFLTTLKKSLQEKKVIQSKKDMEDAKLDQLEAKKDMMQAQKEIAESKQEQADALKEMAEAKKDMALDMEQAKKEMQESKLEIEQSKKTMAEAKLQMEQSRKDMLLYKEQAQKQMEHSKKEMEQSMKQMEQAKLEMEQSNKDQQEIIGDFIKENIIKKKEDLSSYKLSNQELIVNGVKQPGAIHKKFKDKYVKGKDWSRMYNYSAN